MIGPMVCPRFGPMIGPMIVPTFGPMIGQVIGPAFGPMIGPMSRPMFGPMLGPMFGPMFGSRDASFHFGWKVERGGCGTHGKGKGYPIAGATAIGTTAPPGAAPFAAPHHQ